MNLGICDENGVWVCTVMFIFDDEGNIYWMSNPNTRHSKAVISNNKIAGTITFSTKPGEKNLGIQFDGVASKIEGPRYDLALKLFEKRGRPAPAPDQDVLKGNSWYMLKPGTIFLIDEENFGFERQKVQ